MCGRTTAVIYGSKDGKDIHYPFCNHKDVGYPADEQHKDTYERLYLYHYDADGSNQGVASDSTIDTEASTQLFKAGLELGIRKYYKSNPEHLHIDAYQEYNHATHKALIITLSSMILFWWYWIFGKRLYDKTEFSHLLRICYEHIRDCECRLEGKDGCYHCILFVCRTLFQWQRKNLSRERAEELFKRIVDECDGGKILMVVLVRLLKRV